MGTAIPKRQIVRLLSGSALVCALAPAQSLEYRLEAMDVRIPTLESGRLTLAFDGQLDVGIHALAHSALGGLGDLQVNCRSGPVRCADGSLVWSATEAEPLRLQIRRGADGLSLFNEGARIEIRRPARRLEVDARALPLAWIRRIEPVRRALSELDGRIEGSVAASDRGSEGTIRIRNAEFDTPDGWAAGAALNMELAFNRRESGEVSVDATWTHGELLLGPVYLPTPETPIRVEATARPIDSGWRIAEFSAGAGESLGLQADARLEVVNGEWTAPQLRIAQARVDLGWLWRQGLRSLAAGYGWGALEPAGSMNGSLHRSGGQFRSVRVAVGDAAVADGDERIAVRGLDVAASWQSGPRSIELEADWDSGRLYRLPLGASDVALASNDDGDLVMDAPWRIPVLDGTLVVEKLAWREDSGVDPALELDARLEPVDLEALSRRFGWPVMGGSISGRFPGLRLSSKAASFAGGLDLQLFEGSARVEGLSLERPFGNDPALNADLRFDALNLDLLTRAFEFGSMQGLLSGYVRNLRLLSWRPVGFDAWFETLSSSPKREISQRAVDSLSNLSGGGGAAVSGVLMHWFDEFPYRKIGLGCRLAANVCNMRGLRDIDEGGYLILEGRAIPRLDIVGYQRRVDWPRLIEQMRAATAGAGSAGVPDSAAGR